MKYRESEKERKRAVSRVEIICFLKISTNCFRQLINSIRFVSYIYTYVVRYVYIRNFILLWTYNSLIAYENLHHIQILSYISNVHA